MMSRKVSIDASTKTFGRLASEVAHALQGKLFPDVKKHIAPNVIVEISNISKVRFTGKKLMQTLKKTHSGYPGGFSKTSLFDAFTANPEKTFQHSVSRMLPKNRQKKQMLKNITFVK